MPPHIAELQNTIAELKTTTGNLQTKISDLLKENQQCHDAHSLIKEKYSDFRKEIEDMIVTSNMEDDGIVHPPTLNDGGWKPELEKLLNKERLWPVTSPYYPGP
jgi:regulator of replication initiation timing